MNYKQLQTKLDKGTHKRFYTFKEAMKLLNAKHKDFNIIVETGTVRIADNWEDGQSTIVLAELCNLLRIDAQINTVDITQAYIDVCRSLTEKYNGYPQCLEIKYHCLDSIKYLGEFPEVVIDLLYLDSFDCNDHDPVISKASQEHQLQELTLAWPRLERGSVILLDDNEGKEGGKTFLSKQFLKGHNATLIKDTYQSLWTK